MNNNSGLQYKVFFTIKSESMTHSAMNAFARKLILDIDPLAKIQQFRSDAFANCIKYTVTSLEYSFAKKMIHEYNYREFEKCITLAFWSKMWGKYEILIKGAPENTTCRDFFLLMEKFGPISRVTLCKCEPGTAWVEFVHEDSAKFAGLSLEKIGDNIPFIAEVFDNKFLNRYKEHSPKYSRQNA